MFIELGKPFFLVRETSQLSVAVSDFTTFAAMSPSGRDRLIAVSV